MNRAIDSSATHERAIGSVDDGIGIIRSDIADFDDDSPAEKSLQFPHDRFSGLVNGNTGSTIQD
jgi:hypothetical protein